MCRAYFHTMQPRRIHLSNQELKGYSLTIPIRTLACMHDAACVGVGWASWVSATLITSDGDDRAHMHIMWRRRKMTSRGKRERERW